MVSALSSSFTSAHSHKLKTHQPDSVGESDTEIIISQDISQDSLTPPALLKQFEQMLHKALKQTSEHITNSLTKEIRELGNRTATLELKVENMENTVQDFMTEIDNLKEENLTLQTRLEDFENRARRSYLRIRGIPENITDIHATIITLFQELQPGIPIECLEMDGIHRALTPKKVDGPPRDIIAKFHYY